MTGNLVEIENYLGFKLVEDRTVDNLERTRRSGSHNNWKKAFTTEDVEFFKPSLSPVLENFGYTDWTLEPCEFLSAEHYSGYVKRLLGII